MAKKHSKNHRKSRSVLRRLHKKDKLPLFLNIIFHVYFAVTIIWLAFSILSFAGLIPIKDVLFSFMGTSFFIGNEIALIIICAIYFIVAIGLLQLRKWARILAIIFAIIETLFSVFMLIKAATPVAIAFAIFAIVIHGFLVLYFLFSNSVLKTFKIPSYKIILKKTPNY